VKYINLGNTGTKVSQVAIGTWHLPGTGQMDENGVERVDTETFSKIFRKAYDLGVNFFDTANIYHGRVEKNEDHIDSTGNSEKVLGDIIKGYNRESLVISTKVRGPMGLFPNSCGLSRKHIMWQIKESLKRLGTEYVDLYQFHWSDNDTPLNETLKTMSHIIDLDLARYIGMSNINAADIEKFMDLSGKFGLHTFSTIQEPYNIINRGIEENKIPDAKKYNMGLLAYMPLEQGILSGKYLKKPDKESRISYFPDLDKRIKETREYVLKLKELADSKDITLSQLSIAWIIKMSDELNMGIVPLLGITKMEYLEDNMGSLDVKLTLDDMKYINEIKK
jgi:aryl-alcohol dehydrogenase-like predicted oxidoreductase